MTAQHDFSAFTSRLHFVASLTFESAMRIGGQKSQAVDGPDLPLLQDVTGMPYIPGSSFKGALRSYVEGVGRTLQMRPDLMEHNLACLAVGKPQTRPAGDSNPALCLYQNEITALKSVLPQEWHHDGKVSEVLSQRLPTQEEIDVCLSSMCEEELLDRTLRDLSCWVCRVFGSQCLASKVLIKDLVLDKATFLRTEVRDGVGIDRDAGRAAQGFKYQYEVVPAGAIFKLELIVENATEAELGLLWLGLRAFERGEVLLGGAKSRGLGWCKLKPDWCATSYVTAVNLLGVLFDEDGKSTAAVSDEQPQVWLRAFKQAIGSKGGNNA